VVLFYPLVKGSPTKGRLEMFLSVGLTKIESNPPVLVLSGGCRRLSPLLFPADG